MQKNFFYSLTACCVTTFLSFCAPQHTNASSFDFTEPVNINGYSVDIPAILDKNSALWDLLQNFSRPDDDYATCQTATQSFVLENQTEMEVLFPWFWDAQDALDEGVDIFCNVFASLPEYAEGEMQTFGLFENGSRTMNIFDPGIAPDWHNIEDLIIDHPLGTIELTGTIDLFSYDFVFLVLSFADAFSIEQAYISLDSDMINGLKSMGAIITMKNVPLFDDPVILVDGKINEDIISALVYDKDARTLTFNTAHFTSFQAVEASSVSIDDESDDKKRPKIYSAKIEKLTYADGREYFKVTAKGKNFDKDFNMYLGGRKSIKETRVNSKRAIGYFTTADFSNAWQETYKLKVHNSSKRTRTYDHELPITNIPHQFMQ